MTARTPPPRDRAITLDVKLLGRDYKVACKDGEEAELKTAVAFLDRRMHEIRETSKTSSTERIAVMAALNLAHDLLRERAAHRAAASPEVIDAPAAQRRIVDMRSAIDQVLSSSQEKLL